MSYDIGMAAINLEMPERIPRTEYSAELYFDLMKKVTGIDVHPNSSKGIKLQAEKAFRKAWKYDFRWNTLISADFAFKEKSTKMGHASFTQGGSDYTGEVKTLFEDPLDVLSFEPYELLGEIDKDQVKNAFEKNYLSQCANFPNEVNMTGIYVSCISGLIDLFGWDMLLLAAGTDAKAFGLMTNRYSKWIEQYFRVLADSDVPVVMIHDDIVWSSGPFVHPSWYREFVFPNLKRNIAYLKESGKKVMFTSDGNFDEFIDDIADCGVDGFIFEPLTDLAQIAEKYGESHVIIGNADTRIIMYGSKQEIESEVKRCMDIGRNCPGFFMAIGNHISPGSSIENLLYYNECYEKHSKR